MQKLINCIKNVSTGVKKIGSKLKKWASNLFKPGVTPIKQTEQYNEIDIIIDGSRNGNTQTINNNISIGFIIIFAILIFAIICACFVFIYAMTK